MEEEWSSFKDSVLRCTRKVGLGRGGSISEEVRRLVRWTREEYCSSLHSKSEVNIQKDAKASCEHPFFAFVALLMY